MKELISEIKACRICEEFLPHGPRPVFSVSHDSKIAIVGQAPGRIVHESGVPWQDKSGEALCRWLQVSDEEFYDPNVFAIVPMGFCYPGTGKSGDLAPRKECAPQWHSLLFDQVKQPKLVLLIGQYAQKYYLKEQREKNLTETVRNYTNYLPQYFPLPHPSPRNNIWLKKHPWFSEEVLPELGRRVREVIR